MIEDLPLRWATDYVPLAAGGSRLSNTSVLFYDLLHECGPRTRGGATLAVATKANIFLYQTLKGERAFKFVKVSFSGATNKKNKQLIFFFRNFTHRCNHIALPSSNNPSKTSSGPQHYPAFHLIATTIPEITPFPAQSARVSPLSFTLALPPPPPLPRSWPTLTPPSHTAPNAASL
jgi:hypothetical protein